MTGVNVSEIVLATMTPSSSTSHLVVGNINAVTVMLLVHGCDRDDEWTDTEKQSLYLLPDKNNILMCCVLGLSHCKRLKKRRRKF